jgi:exodeoxyribonuclease V gamma subunit
MILDWDRGKENHWQAILWRKLTEGNGKKHRAALQKAFLDALRKNAVDRGNLPTRISVFGISALPAFHLQVLWGK